MAFHFDRCCGCCLSDLAKIKLTVKSCKPSDEIDKEFSKEGRLELKKMKVEARKYIAKLIILAFIYIGSSNRIYHC